MLRTVTYLSPGLPLALFEVLSAELARAGRTTAVLSAVETSSGPPVGDADPFTEGRVDVAFMCAPSYVRLAAMDPPPVRLVPAAPVFDDARNGGRPHYFVDVVVSHGSDARAVTELVGSRWAYNDQSSLSGFACIAHELGRPDLDLTATGSHEASVRSVVAGNVDAAAVDANVLARLLRERPALRHELRVVDTWGPYPVQPIVASARLGAETARTMAAHLLQLDAQSATRASLRELGVIGFSPVDAAEIAAALSWL